MVFPSGFPADGTKREDSGRPSANDVRNFLGLTTPKGSALSAKALA
jgi:hypothetical protein